MNGNIVGEPIEDFVDLQIRTRQSTQFSGYNSLRTDNQLKYLTNRNAWIKLASSVSVQVDTILGTQIEDFISLKLKNIGLPPTGFFGTQLAEKAVLFNTISEYTQGGVLSNNRAGIANANNLWSDTFAYGIGGTDYGIQPPPGIIGVTIDSLNRGSIRKANITLKAHNKFQFDVIELLYLRLGFTMMLEWGWDKYLDSKGVLQPTGNTIIEEEWFKSNGTTQLQMLTNIQKKRREYQGNYDGFFGKVSNFTWNFNPDGSYDISIDLITLGDVIESLKVNTSVKAKYYPDGGLFEDIKFEEGNKLFDTNIAKIATLNTLGYFLYKKIEEISNNKVADKNSYIQFDTSNETSYKSPQYYVRLGEFLTQLEGLIIPVIQNDNSPKFSQITIEKIGCLISYFPNQISLDPRVCIFKPSLNSYGDITGVVNPTYFNSIPISYLASIDNITYGLLMNLYINFEFIAGLLSANGGPDQELSLFKFLQDLCNGINNALGGVNKLEPVIKEDYKITIIDQTLSSPEVKDTVSLEVYGYNPKDQTSNFVKDIKFVSKITPQLASMISIGATAAGSSTSEIDGTAFSKWSEGLVDRFAETISEPNGLDLIAEQEQAEKTREKYAKRFVEFNLADQSIGSLLKEASESADVFNAQVNLLGYQTALSLNLLTPVFAQGLIDQARADLVKAESIDNDLGEKRIVADGYSGITGEMFFEEYLARSIEAEKNDIKNQVFDQNTISQLTSTNYAIYLIKAFGGISGEIKVRFFENTPNQIITGLGSQTSFTSRTATTENLQVNINQSRYREFDDVFISQGKSAYKTYINTLNNNRYTETKTPSSEIGFIPLSFELVLDGISGIKIYNKLKINNKFLPSNYPESLNFIITKVNHNISNNSWDTSLSTISIPKTEPYKYTQLSISENSNGSTIDNVESTFRTDPKQLTVSENLINFLKREEAFRDKAYDDAKPKTKLTATTPITGTLTVGYGFTNAVVPKYIVKPIVWNTTITRDVADQVLTRILKEGPSQTVKNNITVPLTQYEFDALVSIVYNVGNINDSNLVKLKTTLNNKDYQTAASLISQYKTTSGGIFNAGLANRRKKEQQIFISGTY
jgi:GH24 family phage-related lysozyme (muramidase)